MAFLELRQIDDEFPGGAPAVTPQIRGRLQLVASRAGSRRPLAEAVRAAIEGGVDLVQLREKRCSTAELVEVARELLGVTSALGVPLLLNDDVEAAAQLGAAVAGVHLGQDDLPIEQARARLGPDAWIGLSTHSVAEIERGQSSSATHFGLGACFSTTTKADHHVLSRDDLREACARATRPLFAIGGITAANLPLIVELGVRRVAISRAILASDDPGAAAAAIVALLPVA
jgi:thiamine-phosphate pyrophosphorylase